MYLLVTFERPFLRSFHASRPRFWGDLPFRNTYWPPNFPYRSKRRRGWREVGAQPTGHRCPPQGHEIGCELSSRRSTCACKSIYHCTRRMTLRERRFVTRHNNHIRLCCNRGRTDRNIASRPHRCYSLCVLTLHSKPGGLVSSFLQVCPPARPGHSIRSPRRHLRSFQQFSPFTHTPSFVHYHIAYVYRSLCCCCVSSCRTLLLHHLNPFEWRDRHLPKILSFHCNALLPYELRVSDGVARAPPSKSKSVAAWVRMGVVFGNKGCCACRRAFCIAFIGAARVGL